MASPGRDFDPNRKYKLVLSERLKDSGASKEQIYSAVHVDPNLKLPRSIKSAAINGDRDGDNVYLHLEGAKPGEKYIYSGEHGPSRTMALYFNPASQTFTLDIVDGEFNFTQEEDVPSDASQSGDEILDSLKEKEGEADPENPFDWRHQLRKPSPEKFEPFDPISLDVLRTPSPEPLSRPKARAERAVPRKASTPPSEMEIDADAEDEKSPAPHRRDASPALVHHDASPDEDRESSVTSEAPPAPRRAPPSESAASDSDDDGGGGGGLEIVDDGADDRRRGRFAHRQLLANAGEGPISLRSAANSRSPALRGKEVSSGDESDGGMRLDSPVGGGGSGGRRRAPSSPSPSPSPLPGPPSKPAENKDEDADLDVDDFEELEAAFAAAEEEEDGGDAGGGGVPVPATRYEESSSESEEE